MKSVDFKAGYISIIGRPNVGKSTLMNHLLDFRLTITSPRPQTTRRRVMGIMNTTQLQAIFLDTPGLLQPKYALQRKMKTIVDSSISDADFLLYLTDGQMLTDDHQTIVRSQIEELERINPHQKPVLLIINKIDLIAKARLLPLIKAYSVNYPFGDIIPVSALKEEGLADLKKQLSAYLPIHPPYYDTDILTVQPERFFVAEFIREQIFFLFRDEIPYSTEVQIEEFKEREKGKVLIRATIYVEKDSQKGILIGKKGSALKQLGINARETIESFMDREIFLELRIKVSKNWRKSDDQMKRFGY